MTGYYFISIIDPDDPPAADQNRLMKHLNTPAVRLVGSLLMLYAY